MDEQFGLDFLIKALQGNEFVTFKINGVGEVTYETIRFRKSVEQVIRIVDLIEDALNGCNQSVSARDLVEILELKDKPEYEIPTVM